MLLIRTIFNQTIIQPFACKFFFFFAFKKYKYFLRIFSLIFFKVKLIQQVNSKQINISLIFKQWRALGRCIELLIPLFKLKLERHVITFFVMVLLFSGESMCTPLNLDIHFSNGLFVVHSQFREQNRYQGKINLCAICLSAHPWSVKL